MIKNLNGDAGFPDNVEMSVTSTIDGQVRVSLYLPQVDKVGGTGSTIGALVGRITLKPAQAVALIKEIASAITITLE